MKMTHSVPYLMISLLFLILSLFPVSSSQVNQDHEDDVHQLQWTVENGRFHINDNVIEPNFPFDFPKSSDLMVSEFYYEKDSDNIMSIKHDHLILQDIFQKMESCSLSEISTQLLPNLCDSIGISKVQCSKLKESIDFSEKRHIFEAFLDFFFFYMRHPIMNGVIGDTEILKDGGDGSAANDEIPITPDKLSTIWTAIWCNYVHFILCMRRMKIIVETRCYLVGEIKPSRGLCTVLDPSLSPKNRSRMFDDYLRRIRPLAVFVQSNFPRHVNSNKDASSSSFLSQQIHTSMDDLLNVFNLSDHHPDSPLLSTGETIERYEILASLYKGRITQLNTVSFSN